MKKIVKKLSFLCYNFCRVDIMKNIKVVLKMLLVIGIIIPLCSFVLVRADSGWDSDYGGSSFGGSSWSSSSSSWSSSSSSSSSGGSSELTTPMAILVSLFISIHFYCFFQMPLADILDKKNPKIKHGRYLFWGRIIPIVILEIINPNFLFLDLLIVFPLIFIGLPIMTSLDNKNKAKNAKKKMYLVEEDLLHQFLPDESFDSLKAKLFDVFTDVQMAWMNFEYDKLKELCGNELATSYINELDVLKKKNGQNVMHDFTLKDIQIVGISNVSGNIMITVYMTVSFYDYVIDTNTNKVIRGTKNRKLTNNYKLVFAKGHGKVKCPKCGAEFEANGNTNCPYCRTQINAVGANYVLVQKGRV